MSHLQTWCMSSAATHPASPALVRLDSELPALPQDISSWTLNACEGARVCVLALDHQMLAVHTHARQFRGSEDLLSVIAAAVTNRPILDGEGSIIGSEALSRAFTVVGSELEPNTPALPCLPAPTSKD